MNLLECKIINKELDFTNVLGLTAKIAAQKDKTIINLSDKTAEIFQSARIATIVLDTQRPSKCLASLESVW